MKQRRLGYEDESFSKYQQITEGMAQYKEYVFEQLSKKSISAFSGENSSLYVSALSNDAATIESNYLCNIFPIADQAVLFVGALVGASGSGKSTLLNLMMAAQSEYQGTITYDDTNLREIRSEALYEMVSVIQQNVFVFNASIRDNITMFSEFPCEEVDRAIALSGLSQLIAERGEAYLCGENGSGLSGGEKQRISIARSLLKKSQVLLVDEATAALDAQTAYQVFQAILQLQGITRIE